MSLNINLQPELGPLDYTPNINYSSATIYAQPVQTEVSSLNGRLVVNASGSDCLDFITSIPKTISAFFVHRYADFRMFWRSYSSMGSGTTPREVERRINELTQLIMVIESCGNDRNAVNLRFQRLSAQTRNILFYFDQSYVDEFVRDPSMMQEIRAEMIRECERAIAFQRQLSVVNTFYRLFSGNYFRGNDTPVSTTADATTSSTSSSFPPRPVEEPRVPVTNADHQDDFAWNDLSDVVLRAPNARDAVTTQVGRPPRGAHGFNLNVPGTVPYVQNAVPVGVQRKADEINTLKALFEQLPNPPAVPAIYQDIIMAEDFMALPVFDASHPFVQAALNAASSSGATTALNDRNLRHLFDRDALEAHIRGGTTWAPAKCPRCRHPADGGIRRDYLRIDTALQDEILVFLRNAVNSGGSTVHG